MAWMAAATQASIIFWSILEQRYAYSFNKCRSNSQFGKSGVAVKLPSAGSQPFFFFFLGD
jgi:hypothetical protein